MSDRTDGLPHPSDDPDLAPRPGRVFPAYSLDGQALWHLRYLAEQACLAAEPGQPEVNALRNAIDDHLRRYKAAMDRHGLLLPFNEQWPPLPIG